jgi:hypothetical protein
MTKFADKGKGWHGESRPHSQARTLGHVPGRRKKRYMVYVRPEGEEKYRATGETFKKRIDAETFAGVESVAGMGEGYIVKEVQPRKQKILAGEGSVRADRKYMRYLFKHGAIRKNEQDYYSGKSKSGRWPHGLNPKLWAKEYARAKRMGYLTIEE